MAGEGRWVLLRPAAVAGARGGQSFGDPQIHRDPGFSSPPPLPGTTLTVKYTKPSVETMPQMKPTMREP